MLIRSETRRSVSPEILQSTNSPWKPSEDLQIIGPDMPLLCGWYKCRGCDKGYALLRLDSMGALVRETPNCRVYKMIQSMIWVRREGSVGDLLSSCICREYLQSYDSWGSSSYASRIVGGSKPSTNKKPESTFKFTAPIIMQPVQSYDDHVLTRTWNSHRSNHRSWSRRKWTVNQREAIGSNRCDKLSLHHNAVESVWLSW